MFVCILLYICGLKCLCVCLFVTVYHIHSFNLINLFHYSYISIYYRARLESFGFHAIVVDGHDVKELLKAFTEAENTKGKPTCVLAKTFKGQGFPGIADEMNWHGKALGAKSDEVVAHLKTLLKSVDGPKPAIPPAVLDAPKVDISGIKLSALPAYTKGAFGT